VFRSESGTVDAESLAGLVAVGKAIKRLKLRKLVTFHQRIAAARAFVDPGAETSLPALLETLRSCPKDLWTGNVNGGMSAGRGGQLLHEFASHDSVAVIVNVRYLTEGIDVPSIDTVVFTDPRQSQIAIVQAVGRAIRSARTKSLGTIVVPLVFRKSDARDELFDNSRFAAIGDVPNQGRMGSSGGRGDGSRL